MKEYKYNVVMTCSGCSGAVNRVLSRTNGVTNIDISLENQSVSVKTDDSTSYDDVLKAIQKTGKKVIGGETVA